MPDTRHIDATLRAGLSAIPGIVAMATDASGTIYEGAVGVRDAVGQVPMTVDTVFGLASMTKAVVSAAAMQLVDERRLSLSGPIAEVLPETAKPEVLEGFDAAGRAQLRPTAGAITLRHLLTHSSGYGNPVLNPGLKLYLERNNLPLVPENAGQLARWPLVFDPGTRWNYGISTDVVGHAIEAASGQRLDLQMGAGILHQLGMTDSGFVLTPDLRSRLVTTRLRGADESFTDLGFSLDRPVRYCMGGGGMHGTGRDYLRFIRMILNDGMHEGQQILSPASMDAIRRNQLEPGVAVRKMVSSQPAISNDAEFFPGMTKLWSAGFMINTERTLAGRSAGSLSWAGVVNTYFWIDPAAGIGGVFLAQLLPFYDTAALTAFAAFEQAIYDTVG
jgi:methyl acetate hydrolase